MGMYCNLCGSPNIRNSRFRPSDLPRLLLMQSPVRCRSCDGRYFAGIFSTSKLRSEAIARRNERRRRESKSA
jgi:hypothetical protein